MVRVAPFVGLRYDRDHVPDLAAVTAPPYDAIDPEQHRALEAASPFNVVRLELAGRETDADDRYERAAATYRRWIDDGVLVPDDTPRMSVYEQRLPGGGLQVGLLAALGLAPWAARTVLPHERVFRGPVEDRLRLLRAVPANISPVFVLHAPDATVDAVIDEARQGPPAASFEDDGIEHRIWQLAGQTEHQAVAAALAPRTALMADGHHRYTTALEHHEATGAPGTDAILAFLVAEHRGPDIAPMHRLVRRLPHDWRARARDNGFAVVEAADGPHDAPAPPPGGSVVVTAAGWATLLPTDRERAGGLLAASVHPAVRNLDVTRLQALLTGPFAVPDRYEDLVYTPDRRWAEAEVAAGRADALFLVRPVTLAEVRAAATAGVLLPPKSTAFQPKPRTGLVLRPLVPTSTGAAARRT